MYSSPMGAVALQAGRFTNNENGLTHFPAVEPFLKSKLLGMQENECAEKTKKGAVKSFYTNLAASGKSARSKVVFTLKGAVKM